MAALTVTAANVVADSDATVVAGTFGDTVTAGQTVYKDASDSNKWKLADANVTAATAGSGSGSVGVAMNGGANGQPADILTGGKYTTGATNVVGTTYCVSPTAGGIEDDAAITSGMYKKVLGVAISAAKIEVIPGPITPIAVA